MIPVVIESPFGTRPDGTRADEHEVAQNKEYLVACMKDSFSRGEAPFASHRLYPGVLDDNDPEQRKLGMEAGFVWGKLCSTVAVYIDRGITPGMLAGIERARARHALITFRCLSCPGKDFTTP